MYSRFKRKYLHQYHFKGKTRFLKISSRFATRYLKCIRSAVPFGIQFRMYFVPIECKWLFREKRTLLIDGVKQDTEWELDLSPFSIYSVRADE